VEHFDRDPASPKRTFYVAEKSRRDKGLYVAAFLREAAPSARGVASVINFVLGRNYAGIQVPAEGSTRTMRADILFQNHSFRR
jgi:hypothetical protein